jgi:glycerol-3-phosphate acyltransferase PlsY
MTGTESVTLIALLPIAYLLGSVSCAVIVCRYTGLEDPRLSGSHNPGATNVLRTGSRRAAIATLIGDLLKGALPVGLAQALGTEPWIQGLAGLAALLGHLFPLFFRFQGGKGVATTFGVCLVLSWPLGLFQLLCWLASILLLRISSLAALITALLTPVASYWLAPQHLPVITLMCLLLILRHHRNIRNLANKIETHR